jgi:hypothetical protein
LSGKLKGRVHSEEKSIDGKIILERNDARKIR